MQRKKGVGREEERALNGFPMFLQKKILNWPVLSPSVALHSPPAPEFPALPPPCPSGSLLKLSTFLLLLSELLCIFFYLAKTVFFYLFWLYISISKNILVPMQTREYLVIYKLHVHICTYTYVYMYVCIHICICTYLYKLYMHILL